MNPETAARAALLRTLAFHDAWGYAPTLPELLCGCDAGPAGASISDEHALGALDQLLDDGKIKRVRGRYAFAGREELAASREGRESFFPRKLRAAKRVARRLARLDGVRFVALCNTTALANARDQGDLDFFVITRSGVIAQTRGWAALPHTLAGARPGARASERDAVCLSFFVDDSALDLSSLMLPGDDPYFRHWFLSLLPLFDDGASTQLWEANAAIRSRHPLAAAWKVNPDIAVRRALLRVPSFRVLEPLAANLQARAFPSRIRERMNKDTCVVVNDHVLKFHVDDGRERFRSAYLERCNAYDVEP